MKWRFTPRDDIFISYPRQGASTYASGLADQLVKLGFSPFMDRFAARPSPVLTQELLSKIKECRMLVILGTPTAVDRPLIGQEIKTFLESER